MRIKNHLLYIFSFLALCHSVFSQTTIDCYTATGDGSISGPESSNYNNVRNASSGGTLSYTGMGANIGQNYTGNYGVHRGYLPFNTSSIPSDAQITSAVLKVWGLFNYSVTDFDLCVVQSYQSSVDQLTGSDYQSVGSTIGGYLNTQTFSTSGYNEIFLNETGKGWIVKGGWTKLAIRSREDINSSAPTNAEWVAVYCKESSYPPVLTITYEVNPVPPPPPTLTYPSNGATLNDDTPDLAWSAGGSVNYFWVQIATDFSFTNVIREETNWPTLNYTPSPLSDNTYYWKVRSHGTNGLWSDWSEPWSFTIISEIPDIDVNPLTLNIYESGGGFLPNSKTKTKYSSQKLDGKFPTGLIIPDYVKEYWRTQTPQLKYNVRDLQASIDWSSNDSPVKSQGGCGSCWAFVAVGLIENLGNKTDLSEQVIVSCAPGDCGGGWYWDALEYIHNDGVPPESCYPYIAANGNCADMCTDPAFLEKVTQYTPAWGLWGEPATVNDLKAALQNGPLCVAMRVPEDGSFNPSYSGGIYNYEGGYIPPENNGHAVLLVGYDDDQQCFKAKNSWGTNWGENRWGTTSGERGYFRIAYDDVTDDVQFGSYGCTASGVYTEGGDNTFTIENLGTGDLVINNISDNKPWLDFTPQTIPPIPPGGQQVVTVSVIDWNAVTYPQEIGTITISSNDPDEPIVYVNVTAHPQLAPPPAPILSSPLNGATDQPTILTLVWNASSGATSYRLQVDDDPIFGSPIYDQSGLTATSQQVSGLANSTTYYWQVNASNAEGTSPWSSVWYFITITSSGIVGDVNGNHNVNSTDALIVLSCDVGLEVSQFCPMNCGDVNGDGFINSTDALIILSYDVGISVPFPIGQPGCPSNVTQCSGCNP